jgi:hypothetical protein
MAKRYVGHLIPRSADRRGAWGGAPLKDSEGEGWVGAPLTNLSLSNFDLFWTRAAIYFRARPCSRLKDLR